VTASVTVGSAVAGAMVRTPAPGMLKAMVSPPAVALACSMAARRVQLPAPSLQTPSEVLLSGGARGRAEPGGRGLAEGDGGRGGQGQHERQKAGVRPRVAG
jgi:hypothetical protein